ncbi:chromatin assembly factor 1 subunit p90 [Trichomonascus vanleenenianus]|uniref:Rlf2p n=1 Tax=Trichomonascus vanleenenianus TaxID=2268995 RepID=UPI003ECAF54B
MAAAEAVMTDITEEISNKRAASADEEGQATEKTPVKRAKTEETNGSAKRAKEEDRTAKQQEKEREKEREKAERERQKEELKRQREEAKRLKQEEKERKEKERVEEKQRKEKERLEEKRRKEQAREEEKKRKEEERLAKIEEKKRKEQAKLEAKKAKEEAEAAKQKSHPSIFAFFTASKQDAADAEKKDQEEEQEKSYYKTAFLPFCVRSNCKLVAPEYSSTCSEEQSMLGWIASKREKRGGSVDQTVREIMDLVQLGQISESELMKKLESIPTKHLQFGEDVRPPYIGTLSHTHNELATNPFEWAVKTLNYEFDSECEWEIGDEEGSDLGDDDEDDEDIEESDAEMDQFLEEDDSGSGENRRNLVSHLNPIIRWNDGKDAIFHEFQICCMVDTDTIMSEGIDPYKDYWAVEKKKQSPAKPKTALDLLSPNNSGGKKSASLPAGLSAADIKSFLEKVQGQTAIKPILIQNLKEAFPSLSKKTIDATISQVAVKVVGLGGEKQWQIFPEIGKKYGFK